jgi:hypothetical protein
MATPQEGLQQPDMRQPRSFLLMLNPSGREAVRGVRFGCRPYECLSSGSGSDGKSGYPSGTASHRSIALVPGTTCARSRRRRQVRRRSLATTGTGEPEDGRWADRANDGLRARVSNRPPLRPYPASHDVEAHRNQRAVGRSALQTIRSPPPRESRCAKTRNTPLFTRRQLGQPSKIEASSRCEWLSRRNVRRRPAKSDELPCRVCGEVVTFAPKTAKPTGEMVNAIPACPSSAP